MIRDLDPEPRALKQDGRGGRKGKDSGGKNRKKEKGAVWKLRRGHCGGSRRWKGHRDIKFGHYHIISVP